MTTEELGRLANEIAHDVVPPPPEGATEDDVAASFRRLGTAYAAALEALEAGKDEAEARRAAQHALAIGRFGWTADDFESGGLYLE